MAYTRRSHRGSPGSEAGYRNGAQGKSTAGGREFARCMLRIRRCVDAPLTLHGGAFLVKIPVYVLASISA